MIVCTPSSSVQVLSSSTTSGLPTWLTGRIFSKLQLVNEVAGAGTSFHGPASSTAFWRSSRGDAVALLQCYLRHSRVLEALLVCIDLLPPLPVGSTPSHAFDPRVVIPAVGTWLPWPTIDVVLSASTAALEACAPSHLAGFLYEADSEGVCIPPHERDSRFGRLFELRKEVRARVTYHYGLCVPTADETFAAEQRRSAATVNRAGRFG